MLDIGGVGQVCPGFVVDMARRLVADAGFQKKKNVRRDEERKPSLPVVVVPAQTNPLCSSIAREALEVREAGKINIYLAIRAMECAAFCRGNLVAVALLPSVVDAGVAGG